MLQPSYFNMPGGFVVLNYENGKGEWQWLFIKHEDLLYSPGAAGRIKMGEKPISSMFVGFLFWALFMGSYVCIKAFVGLSSFLFPVIS